MTDILKGCQVVILEWCAWRRSLHRTTTRVHENRRREEGSKIEEGTLRVKVSTVGIEYSYLYILQRERVQAMSLQACSLRKEQWR